jgi:hypothetical protein
MKGTRWPTTTAGVSPRADALGSALAAFIREHEYCGERPPDLRAIFGCIRARATRGFD